VTRLHSSDSAEQPESHKGTISVWSNDTPCKSSKNSNMSRMSHSKDETMLKPYSRSTMPTHYNDY